MKYNPPYGSADPNAPFADRNTPAATSGSRVPAAAIEYPQREIMAVIDAAGLSASNADLTQLLQAINHLIAAATGGAGDPNYVLMTQARVRLPIFPEVQASDGIIPIISPGAGQVRVPAGYNFIHRGIFLVTTVQTDFVTMASKTYHLRWAPDTGFVLKDLADGTYNPGGLAEGNAAFDSAYDNMLVARVVTNASNGPTITSLVNKNRMSADGMVTVNATPFGGAASTPVTLNWARRPLVATKATTAILDHNTANCEVDTGVEVNDRYSIGCFYRRTSNQGDGGNIFYQAWL
ncbi:hypothetical protein ACIQUB_06285 [Rhizobium sp. NPDC090275]|uniref:hypothetical protein n=1 Tax=Rhizobium sp. NPDC090275 TaxID=3364498 RepID=UPI00383BCD94